VTLEAGSRTCMLAERAGSSEPCSDHCPFRGGPRPDDGDVCMLERILPFEDWPKNLARRWLGLRDALGAQADRLPESGSSNLHGFFAASSRAAANLGPWQANKTQ
jgi:hypothetical protein